MTYLDILKSIVETEYIYIYIYIYTYTHTHTYKYVRAFHYLRYVYLLGSTLCT